jgi:hypothetical protein
MPQSSASPPNNHDGALVSEELSAEADHGYALVAPWGKHRRRLRPRRRVDVANDDRGIACRDLFRILRKRVVDVGQRLAVHNVGAPLIIVVGVLQVVHSILVILAQALLNALLRRVGRERRVGAEQDAQIRREVQRPSHLEATAEHPARMVGVGPREATWHPIAQVLLALGDAARLSEAPSRPKAKAVLTERLRN